jgi:hypothetical protein
MADAKSEKARRAVRAAQAKFKRDQDAVRKERRKAFAAAQKAGLSLREIAEEVDLHHTRVAEIIRDE